MQPVSLEYKDSMKSLIRGRGYINVELDLTNGDVQNFAKLTKSYGSYFSNDITFLKGERPLKIYGTLEENFCKVDGSMYFLPRPDEGMSYYNNGYVQDTPVEINGGIITLDLGKQFDFKGLTVDFGENYPTKFKLTTDTGIVINVIDNDTAEWNTMISFFGVKTLTLNITEMHYRDNRLRIYKIQFGSVLKYDNTSVLDSKLETTVSPISEIIPQIDLSVSVINDGIYDIENPNSVIPFIDYHRKVKLKYGYQLPNNTIEWINGGTLNCAECKSDSKIFTLNCTDSLRKETLIFLEGRVQNSSYSHLAKDIEAISGLNINLDPVLDTFYTTLALPAVSHKEALQLIANACMCTLLVTRDDVVKIEPFNSSNNLTSDFKVDKSDILSDITVINKERIKEVVVNYYQYNPSRKEENVTLVEEDITVPEDGLRVGYSFVDGDYQGYVLLGVGEYFIIDQAAHIVSARITTPGKYKLKITASKLYKETKEVKYTVDSRGTKVIKWSNPLIDNAEHALKVAKWLGNYYRSNAEYEYKIRGNPEIDGSDVITQVNDYIPDVKVCVTQHIVNFNQSFSGRLVTHKLGGR